MTTKNEISLLGYGWLGKKLFQSLVHEGYRVKISSTTEQKNKERQQLGLNSYRVNLGSDFSVDESFFDSDILVVAIPPRPDLSIESLVDFIEGSRISKVLFTSSSSVYNNVDGEVTEESELKDSLLVKIERYLTGINQVETTVVRFGGLFGKGRHPSRFFEKKGVISNSGGYVNLIHQDDCVQILMKIISNHIWGHTFNACAPSHPTREQFYTLAFEDRHMKAPTMENSGSKGKKVNSSKLIEALNYNYIHPDLIDYWKSV